MNRSTIFSSQSVCSAESGRAERTEALLTAQTFIDVMAAYLNQPIAGRTRRAASLTETGEETLANLWNMRLAEMYKAVIQERMCSLLSEQYPLAAVSLELVPAQAQRDALLRILEETDGGAALRLEYPELARMEDTARTSFETFLDEVFSTLEEKRGEIAQTFFSGRDFGRVTAVQMPERLTMRTRPGSRMTLLLETEGGKFFFKPHVCKTDLLYHRLTKRFFPELHADNGTIVGERASFVKPIELLPLTSEEEARSYYTHMGLLAVLFLALGTFDMHRGNIVPHRAIPVPIDLEYMLSCAMPDPGLPPEIEMVELRKYRSNQFVTSPLYAETRTDLRGTMRDCNRNLPRLCGKIVTVEGYEEDFIDGFTTGFHRVMENAEGFVSLLEDAADTPVRAVLRPHSIYPRIISGMLEPERLRSASALNAWLEKVWDVLPEKERKLYRGLERDVLLSLDYPDFYMRIGAETLYRPDGTVAARNWAHAPLECAKARLNLFSEKMLTECIEQLRTDLAPKKPE